MRSKLNEFWENFIGLIKRREMGVLPGHLAFFFVLSIVPTLSLIFYLASTLNLPVETITNFIEDFFSKEVSVMLTPIIANKSISFQSVFVLVVAFSIACNGASSIILASNVVFNIPNTNYIKRRVKSVVLTVILILLFTFILVVPVFGSSVIKMFQYFDISSKTTDLFNYIYPIINLPISILVIFIFIKLVYTIAPDEKISSKYVNKGALFTTFLWVLITSIYSFYVNNLIQYDIYYGGLSNIVILMLWFYLMSYIFVIGLALNYRNIEREIEKTNNLKLSEISEKVKQIKETEKR